MKSRACSVILLAVVLMLGTAACEEHDSNSTADAKASTGNASLADLLMIDQITPLLVDPSSFPNNFGSKNQTASISAIPFLLTRLASNWLNATYHSMAEYYSAGHSANQNETSAVVSFIGKMAASAFEEIVQPGADLCLSS